ncbi:MAG: TaqI-like C-terminal specificity domain-containing protein, partial [Candidatus Lokiarchaeota archaeon]
VFIEKSIKILTPKKGILSFLTPNKFLAADYGIKIRKFILDNAHIQEIINISSLNSFKHTSTYPIILFLKKGGSHSNFLSIQEFENIQQLDNHKGSKFYTFSQDMIRNFPSCTIPLSTNIELIDRVYSKHDTLSENLKDLKIIYRPFGFVNWKNQSKYITGKKSSVRDMILLGTGNINRYCIDFNKPIKVAKNRYIHPFFSYNKRYKDIWNTLSSEKLIFREIAKDLSFVYDPGIIVNLTGLYFLKISSYNTNQLFSLLAILNSKLINTLYKSLFGTLHMSSGYLRFNGSFIKKLPVPKKIPLIISTLGRILHFLYQLRLELIKQSKLLKLIEINPDKFTLLLDFYENLTNNYVENLYLNSQIKNNLFEKNLSVKNFPEFKFKLIGSKHYNSNFDYYSEDEINLILGNIYKFYNENHKIISAFN